MCPRQRQQQFEGGLALPGLESRQRADGDAGGLCQRGQGEVAALPEGPQPRTHGVEGAGGLIGHEPSLPDWQG